MNQSLNPLAYAILFVFIFIILLCINFLLLYISYCANFEKERRVYQKNVIIKGLLIPVAVYVGINFLSWCGKLFIINKDYEIVQNVLCERVGAIVVLLWYYIYKKRNHNIDHIKNPFPYVLKEKKYYIISHYTKISQQLQNISIVMCFFFVCLGSIFVFNNIFSWYDEGLGIISFILNYGYFIAFSLVYLLVYEIGAFLDGEEEPINKKESKVVISQDSFYDMIKEYKKKFERHLLLTYDKDDPLNVNEISEESSDYIYGKVFTPATEGKNLIIETENLSMLKDVVPPLINLLFATNRKIVFLTENDDESNDTYSWLRASDIISDNSKMVVEVLQENRPRTLINDTNVDICIGTTSLLLQNKEVLKNVDVIFSINIDDIIVNNSINLSIITKILAENKNKKIQYLLFANEVNGLAQAIESVFYAQDFEYQVVRNRNVNDFHAMFYAKDKGWIQNVVLPAVASDALGPTLSLLVTPLKYNFNNLYAFSSAEPYNDELSALHINKLNLKSYVGNKNVNEVEDKIKFYSNEHFVDNDENMVISYDDTENNLVLILNNYLKYSTSRMLLNVVSSKYILRDYMIDNIDFLLQNIPFIGKIVPQHKDGKKLLLFKLLNEMILKEMDEEYLVQEICKITEIAYDKEDAENFIKKKLTELIQEMFGVDLYLDNYLQKDVFTQKAQRITYSYKLLESIKDELPEMLFREVRFIASDQKAKILKHIPLYEMYQNYAEGMYVVFDGKSYVIDSIDYGNGIVNLINNNHIINPIYSHKKDIMLFDVKVKEINDIGSQFQDIKYLKEEIVANAEVRYTGYYEFNNGLTFDQRFYKYHKNSRKNEIQCNKYTNQKGLIISFTSDEIRKQDRNVKLRIAQTLAFMINEIAKTIYHGSNQYLIVRAVVGSEVTVDNEILNLYTPVIINGYDDTISLFIMEDTELEKGIFDSFTLKFDTTILPLVDDYLEWALNERKNEQREKLEEEKKKKDNDTDIYIRAENDEKIDFYDIDKLDFFKLGLGEINEVFDLEGTLSLLNKVLIRDGDFLTNKRNNYLSMRQLVVSRNDEKQSIENAEEKIKDDNSQFQNNVNNEKEQENNNIKQVSGEEKQETDTNENNNINNNVEQTSNEKEQEKSAVNSVDDKSSSNEENVGKTVKNEKDTANMGVVSDKYITTNDGQAKKDVGQNNEKENLNNTENATNNNNAIVSNNNDRKNELVKSGVLGKMFAIALVLAVLLGIYFLLSKGNKKPGWDKVGNVWNYYYEDGKKAINTVIEDAGKQYYLDENGNLVVNGTVEYNGQTFSTNSEGEIMH